MTIKSLPLPFILVQRTIRHPTPRMDFSQRQLFYTQCKKLCRGSGDFAGRAFAGRTPAGVNWKSMANRLQINGKGQKIRGKNKYRSTSLRLSRIPQSGNQIPSHLSSIKVNLVSCISKATNHPAAAVFSAAVLPSASRYLSVSQLFSGIALM